MTTRPDDSRPLSILFVGDASSPILKSRVKSLAESRLKITVLSPIAAKISDQVPVFSPAPPFKNFRLVKFLYFLIKLRSIKADIIHIHFLNSPLAFLAAFLATGTKISTFMGNDYDILKLKNDWLIRFVLKRSSVITLKSKKILNDFLQFYPNKKSKIIHWGVNNEEFSRLRSGEIKALKAKWNAANENFVFLSSRNCSEKYNILEILEVFSEIVCIYPQTRLWIIKSRVDPKYLSRLEEKVKRLSLQNKVRFLPELSPIELNEIYNIADLLLNFPLQDHLPNTLYEAVFAGLKCVSIKHSFYDQKLSEFGVHYSNKLDAGEICNLVKDFNSFEERHDSTELESFYNRKQSTLELIQIYKDLCR